MRSIHILFFFLVLCLLSCRKTGPFDIIIKGGSIIDGTGAPAQKGDIGIFQGKITVIGNLQNAKALRVIDASGLTVSPGFIDMHAHIEEIMDYPAAENHVRQGVTTVLGGPDGAGPWPFGKYLDSLENHFRLGINIAYLTGHNGIRWKVMGNENRRPTEAELERMKDMVRQAMLEGAFGMSTGLKYLPGTFAETSEVIELSKIAGSMGGIYTSHLREEGLGLLDAVKEAITIGKEASIPVVLTHHKVIGRKMWGSSRITTAWVDSARNAGIDVMMDQYPYTASFTGIAVMFPSWVLEGSREVVAKRLADKALRDSILSGIEFNIINDRGGGDIRLVQFGNVPWDTTLNGETLYDYAIRQGVKTDPASGAKLILDIQMKGGASCIFHAMSDEDVERIMKHPFTMIASDGGQGFPHPRAYGTFPRVLGRYVREKKLLGLEEAIHKMTGLPASRLGLADRGLLKNGYFADITIFDPGKIIDNATYEEPFQYPSGIEYVLVNGVVTVEKDALTNSRAGKVLRGPAYKSK